MFLLRCVWPHLNLNNCHFKLFCCCCFCFWKKKKKQYMSWEFKIWVNKNCKQKSTNKIHNLTGVTNIEQLNEQKYWWKIYTNIKTWDTRTFSKKNSAVNQKNYKMITKLTQKQSFRKLSPGKIKQDEAELKTFQWTF